MDANTNTDALIKKYAKEKHVMKEKIHQQDIKNRANNAQNQNNSEDPV